MLWPEKNKSSFDAVGSLICEGAIWSLLMELETWSLFAVKKDGVVCKFKVGRFCWCLEFMAVILWCVSYVLLVVVWGCCCCWFVKLYWPSDVDFSSAWEVPLLLVPDPTLVHRRAVRG